MPFERLFVLHSFLVPNKPPMARDDNSSRLTGICVLVSLLWLSYSLDRHSLIDQPRLSGFLLLLTSGALVFAASFFSKRLPGADGRFDSDALLKGLRSSLPQKPRRFYIPCIILLIVVRLEILYRILYDFQCTARGIEASLPVFLVLREVIFHRKGQNVLVSSDDEPEDMWGSCWDDLKIWWKNFQLTLLLSTLFLSWSTFRAVNLSPKSSSFCSAVVDQGSWVVFLQWVGVLLDAILLVLLWRVLSWQRTTKTRLITLSGILTISSASAGFLWLAVGVLQRQSVMSTQTFRGLNSPSLYLFDILTVGGTVAILAISAALWICDSAPLIPTAIVTFSAGIWLTPQSVWLVGTYQQPSYTQPLTMFIAISTGFIIFTGERKMHSIILIYRPYFITILVSILVATAMFSWLQNRPLNRHPVDELVYRNRIETDRWLRHASVSTNLKTAVSEYKERHHGRDPPANFDKWFEFALQRKSAIMDHFGQIDKDILPFWGIKPQKIRDSLEIVKGLPDVGIIAIAEGKVSHDQPPDSSQKVVLDEAVSMISSFSEHLPDMFFAVNLNERPRVLVPWEDVHRLTDSATKSRSSLLSQALGTRQAEDAAPRDSPAIDAMKTSSKQKSQTYVSPQVFHDLQALACPPGSAIRARVGWNVRDHCASCANPHSLGHFLRDWGTSLDICHQPDLFHLHDFHTQPHQAEIYQDFLPIFSRSKAAGFNDILIPLIRSTDASIEAPDAKGFDQKLDNVFWQDEPTTTALFSSKPLTHSSPYGSHRSRLVHMSNNATAADSISMLLEVRDGKQTKYRYEKVSVSNANGRLPMAVSFTSPYPDDVGEANGKCANTPGCQHALREFGFQPRTVAPLDNRYILLLDTANGPAPNMLSSLRSNSVPVLSSIFTEWFTERLMPWTHFVPVDPRYHSLHSTLAYFTGLKNHDSEGNDKHQEEQQQRKRSSDSEAKLEHHLEDARWVAEQGSRWAARALRREDMEIYMFRLLLEWGRVIHDDRDRVGFILDEKSKI